MYRILFLICMLLLVACAKTTDGSSTQVRARGQWDTGISVERTR